MSSIEQERFASINSRMMEMSKDSLKKQFLENHDEIVAMFGGLENMTSLCLTNPKAWDQLDPIKIETFDQKILMNIADHNENVYKHTLPDFHMKSIELVHDDTRKDTGLAITNNKNDENTEDRDDHENCVELLTVETLEEYDNACIVIKADICDNFYFKIFSKSDKNLIKIYQRITNNKFWIVSVICVFLLLVGVDLMIYLGTKQVKQYGSVLSVVSILFLTIMDAILLLTANIKILKLILDTFEFWFKVFNAIISLLTYCIINYYAAYTEWWIGVIWGIAGLFVFATEFVADSLSISRSMKKVITVFVALYILFDLCWVYYTYSSFEWNPLKSLNSQFTGIDFKSVLMSSLINIALFVLKPFWAYLLQCISKKLDYDDFEESILKSIHQSNQSRSLIDDNTNREFDQKYKIRECVTVKMSPFVQWQLGLNKIVQN